VRADVSSELASLFRYLNKQASSSSDTHHLGIIGFKMGRLNSLLLLLLKGSPFREMGPGHVRGGSKTRVSISDRGPWISFGNVTTWQTVS
jgi:hypothetical protein